LNVRFRDVKFALPFACRFGSLRVFYPARAVLSKRMARRLRAQSMTGILEAFAPRFRWFDWFAVGVSS